MTKLLRCTAVSALVFMFLAAGCSNQVALNKNTLQKEQTVSIKLTTGQTVNGLIQSVNEQTVSIFNPESRTSTDVQKSQVAEISGPQPYYDAKQALISEKEIEAVKTNKKFWTYTISGGLVSAGASFFLSSMIAKSSSDDIEDPIILSGTAAGTVLGAWLFSRVGSKKDKLDAVDSIRLARAGKSLNGVEEEIEKQKRVQMELEKLKKEREDQEAEIEKLRKKVEEK